MRILFIDDGSIKEDEQTGIRRTSIKELEEVISSLNSGIVSFYETIEDKIVEQKDENGVTFQ